MCCSPSNENFRCVLNTFSTLKNFLTTFENYYQILLYTIGKVILSPILDFLQNQKIFHSFRDIIFLAKPFRRKSIWRTWVHKKSIPHLSFHPKNLKKYFLNSERSGQQRSGWVILIFENSKKSWTPYC